MLFEKAARMKVRFKTSKGLANVEDLWDLPLKTLDTIAKELRRQLQDSNLESFIAPVQTPDIETELKFRIVKQVIAVLLTEAKTAEQAAVKRQKRVQIIQIIEAKDNEALHSSSKEELMALLENL